MMLAHRHRERLAVLDHETLLSYAAELSFAHRHTADALLAKRSPLPAWARDEVMLSADLLPHVFATLQMKDNAAASVCQAWKAAWVATNDGRRGLRPSALPEPDFPTHHGIHTAAELPDGNLVLVHGHGFDMRIVDQGVQTIRTIEADLEACVANEFGLFATCRGTSGCDAVRRYDLDTFTMTHEYDSGLAELEEHRYDGLLFLALADGGLLFVLGGGGDEEVVCFDARTLKVRHRFGRGLYIDVWGMAAGGNELFVLDSGSNAIKVFSLAGSLLRSFGVGACVDARHLHHFDGRLYLLDNHGHNSRIVVLTPEGERLQVWRPDADREVSILIGIHCRKLLMRTSNADGNEAVRLEALQGV